MPGDESTIVAIRRALVSGIPTIGPSKRVVDCDQRELADDRVAHVFGVGLDRISIERRTCGMLRRPRLEESS